MDKDEIIKEQSKTIALMKAHYQLALTAVTDLEKKLGGIDPPGFDESLILTRAERREAAFRRRSIPIKE